MAVLLREPLGHARRRGPAGAALRWSRTPGWTWPRSQRPADGAGARGRRHAAAHEQRAIPGALDTLAGAGHQPSGRSGDDCGTGRAEVRRILGRRRRRHQARGAAHRGDAQGRRFGGRGGLRHGRHHRRAAGPGQPGEPAAAGPRARHAADRRGADLDGAAGHGHREPRPGGPLVHRLAGRRDHRLGARQGPHHRRDARPDPARPRRRRDPDRGRLPGRVAGHQGHHHARPGRLGHHRGGAGRRARRRRVRDLHRRGRRLHRRPADRAQRPAHPADQLRGNAGDGGVRGQGPDAALRGVRPAVLPSRSTSGPRSATGTAPGSPAGRPRQAARRDGGRGDGAGDHLRGRARPERGEDHRRGRAGQGRRGGPDLPGHRRRRRSTST